MLNLIHAEIYKLTKSTGAKVAFIISSISAISLACISHFIARGTLSTDIIGSASGLSEVMIISLLGSLMAGILVCTDFETKTIHDAVVCGDGRRAVVLSKIIVFVLMIAILMLPYAIVTLIGFSTGAEFIFVSSVCTNIMAENVALGVSASVIFKIIAIFLVEIIVYAGRLSICIPIAFKAKKPIVVMGIGFILSGLIDLVIVLMDKIPGFSKIISITPYYRDYILIPMGTGVGTLLKVIGISVLFIVIMTLIAYKIFKRAEIK